MKPPPKPLPFVALAWITLVSIGCARGPGWSGTIEEREGVTYVSNPAQGLWDTGDGPSIRFELDQTFGAESEPAEAILNGIWRQAFDVDDAGNVYIYDGGDERLVSFAPDGSFRWSGGAPGQGPGEFSSAEGMAWNGASTIYVTNGAGARVDLWSTDGGFVESRSISHLGFARGSLVGVLDEHTVVLQANSMAESGVRVGVVDLRGEGELVADFDVDVTSAITGSGANMEVETVHGSIVIGDRDSYDLRLYSREGSLERVVSRDSGHMVVPATREESREHGGVVNSSWLSPPVPMLEGRMLAAASWTDPTSIERLQALPEPPEFTELMEAYRMSLDLFDADGRLLSTQEHGFLEMGRPEEVDADGNVYAALMEPFPHVRRYRVVIEDR